MNDMNNENPTPTTQDTPTQPRARRPSLPVEPEVKEEIESVAEDLGIPVTEVRERASVIASGQVLAKLRASLGKERVDAVREELARLEGAAGLPLDGRGRVKSTTHG